MCGVRLRPIPSRISRVFHTRLTRGFEGLHAVAAGRAVKTQFLALLNPAGVIALNHFHGFVAEELGDIGSVLALAEQLAGEGVPQLVGVPVPDGRQARGFGPPGGVLVGAAPYQHQAPVVPGLVLALAARVRERPAAGQLRQRPHALQGLPGDRQQRDGADAARDALVAHDAKIAQQSVEVRTLKQHCAVLVARQAIHEAVLGMGAALEQLLAADAREGLRLAQCWQDEGVRVLDADGAPCMPSWLRAGMNTRTGAQRRAELLAGDLEA